LCVFITLNSFCCFGPGTEPPPDRFQVRLDSIARAEAAFMNSSMEDLIGYRTADSLLKCIPDYALYDTIGVTADSLFTITEYYPDSNCYVRLYWKNSESVDNLMYVVLSADEASSLEEIKNARMKSRTGVKLGMDLQEVQNINHEPFFIYGIGGDSSLQFISWDRGYLYYSGLKVDYFTPGDHSDCNNHLICGDTAVVSNEPALREIDTCYVRAITLHNARRYSYSN
jgi:hypothetical protein